MRPGRHGKILFVGIDVGTTALKAAAFDGMTGSLAAQAQACLRVVCGQGGTREYPKGALTQAMEFALCRLRTALGARWLNVEGLGIAAQGGSGTVADRKTGAEKMGMMLWNDSRSMVHLGQISSLRPPGFWQDKLMTAWVPWGLGRILWLRKNRPELFDPDRYVYAGAGELVFFHLTGTWRQDAGNAVQAGCYNARSRALDGEIFGLAGAPLSFVAGLREGHQTAALTHESARKYGLRPGIPVAGPYMDHEAGYMSSAGACDSPLQVSLGTAWVGNYRMPAGAKWSSPSQLVLPSPVKTGWLVVQPLRTGNVSWDWALDMFAGGRGRNGFAAAERIFSERLLPPPGVFILPWLTSPNRFAQGEQGGGLAVGLNPQTTAGDLLRAVAAGMCCEMARVFQAVRDAGVVDAVVLCGGASKGRCFRTMLSALFHPLPVLQPNDPDLSGVRGSLHVFGIPACPCRKLTRPSAAMVRCLRSYAAGYMRLFESLFSDDKDLAGIRIGRMPGRRNAS